MNYSEAVVNFALKRLGLAGLIPVAGAGLWSGLSDDDKKHVRV